MISLSNGCYNCDGSDCTDSCPSEIIDECEVVCGPGRVSSTKNSCVLCTEGKYSDPAAGTTSCTGCPDGSIAEGCEYSPLCALNPWCDSHEGCKACRVCPAGTFAHPGGSDCELCPPGTISAEGSTECSQCADFEVTDPSSCFTEDEPMWFKDRSGCSACIAEKPPMSASYSTCPNRFGRDVCRYWYDASNPTYNQTIGQSKNKSDYVKIHMDNCYEDELACQSMLEIKYEKKRFKKNSQILNGGDLSPFASHRGSSCLTFSLCSEDGESAMCKKYGQGDGV